MNGRKLFTILFAVGIIILSAFNFRLDQGTSETAIESLTSLNLSCLMSNAIASGGSGGCISLGGGIFCEPCKVCCIGSCECEYKTVCCALCELDWPGGAIKDLSCCP